MTKFGILKSKIENVLLESYKNDTFKDELKTFKKLVLENKNVSKRPKKFFLDDDKRTALLSIFGASIVEKVIDKKLSKDEMCFIILTIVNLLKLSDHDLKMFHQKNVKQINVSKMLYLG